MAFDEKTATKTECIADANRWLDKAVGFEADVLSDKPGSREKSVDMAFKQALKRENMAFDGRV